MNHRSHHRTPRAIRTLRAVAAGTALAAVLAACGSNTPTGTEAAAQQEDSDTTSVAEAIADSTADSTAQDTEAASGATTGSADGLGLIGLVTHADGDEADYDAESAVSVTLDDAGSSADGDGVEVTTGDDGQTVRLTVPGTYVLSGTLTAGQVVVDVTAEEDVTVVLDGVDITSTVGPALQVVSAEDATVVLADGSSNHLADPADYAVTEDTVDEATGETVDAPNAALYSTADLTIAGDGALSVDAAFNDGITSKDGLVILSGDLDVSAADDGIRGKDFLAVQGGTITVDAVGDGLTSDNTDDGTGIVVVSGSDTSVTVASGDDGVTAANVIDVVEGTLTVTSSVEGVESARIILEGGTVSVTSTDDGINAVSDTVTPSIEISGGTLTVDAEGDGVDSNGTLTMTGGQLTVHGPTRSGNGSLDVQGEFVVSGGTLIAVGPADMLVGPSTDSGQSAVVVTLPQTVEAGTVLTVTDADGGVVAEVTTTSSAQSLVLSDPALVAGETYSIAADGTETATAVAGEYAAATGGPGGGGFPGGGGGRP